MISISTSSHMAIHFLSHLFFWLHYTIDGNFLDVLFFIRDLRLNNPKSFPQLGGMLLAVPVLVVMLVVVACVLRLWFWRFRRYGCHFISYKINCIDKVFSSQLQFLHIIGVRVKCSLNMQEVQNSLSIISHFSHSILYNNLLDKGQVLYFGQTQVEEHTQAFEILSLYATVRQTIMEEPGLLGGVLSLE